MSNGKADTAVVFFARFRTRGGASPYRFSLPSTPLRDCSVLLCVEQQSLRFRRAQRLAGTPRARIGHPACLSSKPSDGFAVMRSQSAPNRFPGPLIGSDGAHAPSAPLKKVLKLNQRNSKMI